MSAPIVGIDLGTTNSVVAIADQTGTTRVLADKQGLKVQPSVVAFPPSGRVLVGTEAKDRKIIDPHNTIYSVKRLMGRTIRSPHVQAIQKRMPYRITEGDNQQPIIKTRAGDFAPSDISAIILDHMRDLAQGQLGDSFEGEIDRAVVTVPANFNEAQRGASATAGAIAGITVVRVLNEPTAAALAYGQKKNLNGLIAVYDFGGGTFDVSLLKLNDDIFEVIGTSGDSMLGGDDVDERLVEGMCGQFLAQHRLDLRTDPSAMMRLRQLAENVKIELSRRMTSKIHMDEIAYGPGGRPLAIDVEMTRQQFVHQIRDLVDRTFPVCEEALSLAGVQLSDITDVVLVGGTTRIPYVQEQVARFFGQQPRTDINPEEAVAMGAGLQGEQLRMVLDGGVTAPRGRAVATQDDTLAEDTINAGTTMRRPAATPPPVPGRQTMKGPGVRPNTDDAPTQRQPPQAALGRMPLKQRTDTASIAVKEIAKHGAVKQPAASAGPNSRTLIADEFPLAAPASTTVRNLDAQRPSGDVTTPRGIPTVHDVTPHSLGIATVGGFCELLVNRNAQLPITRERVFTSARDGQVQVRIRVCQGESRRLSDNTIIGDLVLAGLPIRDRGQTKISVTFQIDESGILNVKARDAHTGQERRATVNVLGAQSDEQVVAARSRMNRLRPS